MSVTFTKLFTSITESTVWFEPDSTRLVWITMLAMADRKGRVFASVPGLAHRARVTEEQCEAALKCFLSPDTKSRTKDHEGRRIEEIDGGWVLLNHEKYRSIRDEEVIKESKRVYAKKMRAKEKEVEKVEQSRPSSNSVDRVRHNAEADTEADTDQRDDNDHPISKIKNNIIEIYNSFASKNAKWAKCSKIPSGEAGKLLDGRAREPEWIEAFPEQMTQAIEMLWITNGTLTMMLRPDTQRKILDGEWGKEPYGGKTFEQKRDLYQAPEGYDGPFA